MLHIHFLQRRFNLCGPAMEKPLCEPPVFQRFAGADLGKEPVPDETLLRKLRHLPEKRNPVMVKRRS